jgi:hypothetical protein
MSQQNLPPGQDWLVRIEGALNAHFKQPDGASRPGTDYAVGLKRGEETQRVMVRAYLSPDLTPAARADTEYQAQTVMRYVFDRLKAGWSPAQPLPPLTIVNPDPGHVHAVPRKRSLFARLFRG